MNNNQVPMPAPAPAPAPVAAPVPAPSVNTSGGVPFVNKIADSCTTRTVMYVIGAILLLAVILLVLWRVYKSYSDYNKENPMLVKGMRKTDFIQIDDDFSKNVNPYKMIPKSKFKPSKYTNGWTYSFWIRVDDWNYKYGEAKHIFHRGDRDGYSVSPGLWLHPTNNSIMVRLHTRSSDELMNRARDKMVKVYSNCNYTGADQSLRGTGKYPLLSSGKYDSISSLKIPAGLKCTIYESPNFKGASKTFGSRNQPTNIPCLTKHKMYGTKTWNYNISSIRIQPFSDSMNPIITEDFSEKMCDIHNIPIQRWLHIALVLHNKTLDVFVNGKLRRSCQYENPPVIQNGDLHITDRGGFRGYLGNLRYYNRIISPEQIFSIYNKGIKDPSYLDQLKKKLQQFSSKKCY